MTQVLWPHPGTGALGLVQAIHAVSRGWRPADDDLDEWLCVSSVAFAHYVFDPSLNLNDAFSPLGLYFTNYGVFEALSHYTAIALQEVNNLPAEQLWEVLTFESEEERPVLSLGFGDALEPVIVLDATDGGVGQRSVRVLRRSGETEEIDMWGRASTQGTSEDFVNWALLVRPGTPPPWTIAPGRQRLNTLRWALRHARSSQEFFHETRENYVTGLRGFERLSTWSDDAPAHPSFESYLQEHLQTTARARAAAAVRLDVWADELPEQEGVVVHDASQARDALKLASQKYHDASQALASSDIRVAGEHEARAVDALGQALDQFPVVM